jgi:hypothetical protein
MAAQRTSREPCLSVERGAVNGPAYPWNGSGQRGARRPFGPAFGGDVLSSRGRHRALGRARSRAGRPKGRAVKAGGRRPLPEGQSLDGPVGLRQDNRSGSPGGASYMQLLVRRPSFRGVELRSGGCGRPCLSRRSASRSRRRLQDGVRGVPTNVVRPLVLGRLSSRAGSNRVAGSWSQIIECWTPARPADGRWIVVRPRPRRRRRRRCVVCGSSGARACGPR